MAGLSSFLGGLTGGGLGTVLVEVGLDTKALDAQLAKVKTELNTQSTALGNSNAITKTLSTSLIALGAAAVIGIGKAVEGTIQWANEVRGLQLVTGQSAES